VACIQLNVIAIRCRLANFADPSSDRNGVPHLSRFALYANPSEFQTPEISQRGLRTLLAPVGLGCPPPLGTDGSDPLSPTIDRDGLSSAALPYAGERIFIQHHNI